MAPRILVLGMSDGGAASLPQALAERVLRADLLVGGARHLAAFPGFAGATVAIRADLGPAIRALEAALAEGRRAAVLASGDPLCYGVGASLRRHFPAEALEIVPAPSAFQLAFAALAEPWHDAALLSAHGRPPEAVVRRALAAPLAAILTDDRSTPAALARAMLAAGLPPETPAAVCERLGGPSERVARATLAAVAESEFDRLNVLVVWPGTRPAPCAPGLPDEAFATERGQITKRELRLLSLAELALGPGEVLWDIGAGSGSVAIEAARAQPSARVFAAEQRAAMCQHIRENLRRFPAPNLHLAEGRAPEVCASWPDPDALFIGGSGGALDGLVALARARLRPGGRLVINLATIENLQQARALLPEARAALVQISRAVPILDMTRLEALNPVFVLVARNEGGGWSTGGGSQESGVRSQESMREKPRNLQEG